MRAADSGAWRLGANAAPAMTAASTAESTRIPAARTTRGTRPAASKTSTPGPAARGHRVTARGRPARFLPVRFIGASSLRSPRPFWQRPATEPSNAGRKFTWAEHFAEF